MKNFLNLGLSAELQRALPELGFDTPTPIQVQAISVLTADPRDLIGLAQTGTGKTAAFGLPLLDAIDPDLKKTQAVILAPTRELVQQITTQMHAFSKYLNIKTSAVYGGSSVMMQLREVKNTPHIVVATPGRLIDFLKRKAVKLDNITHVVLDEADEMLNMGFKEDIDFILSHTPENKLTWLFSATMPNEIRNIVHTYMYKPAEISVGSKNEVNVNIEHQYTMVKEADKSAALQRFLDLYTEIRAIVFCRTKNDTQHLADELKRSGYAAEPIHGDLSQQARDRVMKMFKDHTLQILIATDVAARGIDVNNLTHVVHYSLPDDIPYYTHRSGRTARAGKTGISLALISHRDAYKLRQIEKKLNITFAKVDVPVANDIIDKKISHWASEIVNSDTEKGVAEHIYNHASSLFADITKEELIAKLLVNQMDKLSIKNASRDLNDKMTERRSSGRSDEGRRGSRRDRTESSGGYERTGRRERSERSGRRDRSDRSERFERPENLENPNMDRYFINLGSIDKVNKNNLIDFICEQAKVTRKDIGSISLQKKCAFFEVDKKYNGKIISGFKNVSVGGRKLRVNREHAE